MTTNEKISLQILVKIDLEGLSVQEAVDAVIGAGTYARIASDVYDGMKAGNANFLEDAINKNRGA